MPEDIIIHGDFVQFLRGSRCEACRASDLKCVLQQSDDDCMTCAGAHLKCVFTRQMLVSGPKTIFPWLPLLGQEEARLRVSHSEQLKIDQQGSLVLACEHCTSAREQDKIWERSILSPKSLPSGSLSRSATHRLIAPRPSSDGMSSTLTATAANDEGFVAHDPEQEINVIRPLVASPVTLNQAPNSSKSRKRKRRSSDARKATAESLTELRFGNGRDAARSPNSNLNNGLNNLRSGPGTAPQSRTSSTAFRFNPTLNDFMLDIQAANPKIQPFFLERYAKEQLIRFERLLSLKISHSKDCQSGERCANRQGVVAAGPVRHVKSTNHSLSEMSSYKTEDSQDLPGGPITALQFSYGHPLPPVKYLPAEFECPFCFQMKKIDKPSDWTKHVHEDLQPFVCSVPDCPDIKSFKRKADWIRHENERHRKLEWWTCTMEGCGHLCYRKDNFIQHLVREHKMQEPRAPKRFPYNSRPEIEEAIEDPVWKMLKQCWHESKVSSLDEPCVFCGHKSTTFKHLSRHLATHMEQVALPILEMVLQHPLVSKGASDTASEDHPEPLSMERRLLPHESERPRDPPYSASKAATSDDFESAYSANEGPEESQPARNGERRSKRMRRRKSPTTPSDGSASAASSGDENDDDNENENDNDNDSDTAPSHFRCVGRACSKNNKIWTKRHNFRMHVQRMHLDEDTEELIRRSSIDPRAAQAADTLQWLPKAILRGL